MNADTLRRAVGNITRARARSEVAACNDALRLAGCTTVAQCAQFLAQIGTESMSLRYTSEIASGTAYNGRRDLGNTQPGDGPRFKGRSYIQVTGRHNYAALSRWAHQRGKIPNSTYFVSNPTKLAAPAYRWLGPAWYWQTRNMTKYGGNVRGATIAVNGGTNGLADRRRRYNRARALGSAILPGKATSSPTTTTTTTKADKDRPMRILAHRHHAKKQAVKHKKRTLTLGTLKSGKRRISVVSNGTGTRTYLVVLGTIHKMNSREWLKVQPYAVNKGKVTKRWRVIREPGNTASSVVTLDRTWSLVVPKGSKLRLRTWSSKGSRHKVSALMADLLE